MARDLVEPRPQACVQRGGQTGGQTSGGPGAAERADIDMTAAFEHLRPIRQPAFQLLHAHSGGAFLGAKTAAAPRSEQRVVHVTQDFDARRIVLVELRRAADGGQQCPRSEVEKLLHRGGR